MPEGRFSGQRQGDEASWVTDGSVMMRGRFQGSTFVGSVTFPADGEDPERVVPIRLTR